jgi:hypothetical protein
MPDSKTETTIDKRSYFTGVAYGGVTGFIFGALMSHLIGWLIP